MPEKLVIGPFKQGIQENVIPAYIDNDSFQQLINAYQWRGRIKRKRGTSSLTRCRRYFDSTIASYTSTSTIALDGSGTANLITGFSLESNASIEPGRVTITVGANVYTDPASDGVLSGPNAGTINYASGSFTIAAEAGNNASAHFFYNPMLPVLGLPEFVSSSNAYPLSMAFDQTYSYNIQTTYPYRAYDVSFYKNPPSATWTNYVKKTNYTPTTWNGEDYRQFDSVNFQGAIWVTNTVNVPFSASKFGMQYGIITIVDNITTGPPSVADLSIANHGLSIGDFVFVNEVATTTGINFQTGYVTAVPSANKITVTFPNATIATNGTGGIAQFLTNRSDTTRDCIRFYDGDPTNSSSSTPALTGNYGWVNFCPPISQSDMTIGELPPDQYYLIGCKIITTFKDRILFIGPVLQTSAPGSQVYLQDTIIYSQNGTPYYTASFTENPTLTSATTQMYAILTPDNQTGDARAYFGDSTGFGGFISAGLDEAFTTLGKTENVLILGSPTNETRVTYNSNDFLPFTYYNISSNLGSGSQFSAVNFENGVITIGSRGFVYTTQNNADRFDEYIPDRLFDYLYLGSNGAERVTAIRDYTNKWMYFSYPQRNRIDATVSQKFNNATFLFNYEDKSWAVFYENVSSYGYFRKRTGFTWATVGETYETWKEWNDPWNASQSNLLQPQVIAGNQQGYIFLVGQGTGEGYSLAIKSLSANTLVIPNHGLTVGEYFIVNGALGDTDTVLNTGIFSVDSIVDADTITTNPPFANFTYGGSGQLKRMYVPFIQTKQFPPSWGMMRKTRIGTSQYLFTTTYNGSVTVYIYLSQDDDNPYNEGGIVPAITNNSSLIYDATVYTCPESSNLGLTPFNTNLQQMVQINAAGDAAASPQQRIWHRMNTSLIGDTVQLAITLSDSQMRDRTLKNQYNEIELHGIIMDLYASGMLA